jgi:transcriptional regulator with XRE-family HTH domain
MLKLSSPKALGKVLRATRTQAGVQAETLAGMSGISAVTLRRFESGEPTEAIENLFSLCRELGIEINVSLPPGIVLNEHNEDAPIKRTRVKS